MKYRVCVDGFGKIKHAEVESAPLTFFVGDNNSGKSYLLTLFWALHSVDTKPSCLFDGISGLRTESANRFRRILLECIEQLQTDPKGKLVIKVQDLVNIINKLLENNKDKFISSIFNSQEVTVGRIWIESEEEEVVFKIYHKNHIIYFDGNGCRHGFSMRLLEDTKLILDFLQNTILESCLSEGIHKSIYLPAARTGFMLSKDIINKVGRQEVFDFVKEHDRVDNALQPFSKPIIEFLNEIESLSTDNKSHFEEIVKWIEGGMMNGNLQYEEVGKKEIRYFPHGRETSIPLRATSAVVTELTPLVLILKYKRYFSELCYEEPEMCLHPQLQLKMGQLLIRMVNEGLNVIATTHSDIILQHVNNMCRLHEMGMPGEVMEKCQLETIDVLDREKVAIYQFTDQGDYSTVERIQYTEGMFQIPTFQNALLGILEQTSQIQDFED